MQVKTYGIYDGIQEEYVRTFNAKNDEDARRASSYIVKEQGFDDKSGKDRSINYLYTLDTDTGIIVDNSVHLVCNLATFIEERKHEEMETLLRQKLMTEQFIKEVQEQVKIALKGELKHGREQEEARS